MTEPSDTIAAIVRRLQAEQACRDLVLAAADAVQQVGEIRDQLALTPDGWRIRRREAWFTLVRDATAG